MGSSQFILSEDVVAIHAKLVPTANGNGEILIISGDNHSHAGKDSVRLSTTIVFGRGAIFVVLKRATRICTRRERSA